MEHCSVWTEKLVNTDKIIGIIGDVPFPIPLWCVEYIIIYIIIIKNDNAIFLDAMNML